MLYLFYFKTSAPGGVSRPVYLSSTEQMAVSNVSRYHHREAVSTTYSSAERTPRSGS